MGEIIPCRYSKLQINERFVKVKEEYYGMESILKEHIFFRPLPSFITSRALESTNHVTKTSGPKYLFPKDMSNCHAVSIFHNLLEGNLKERTFLASCLLAKQAEL